MSLFRVCMFLVVLASAPSPADACQCRYRGPAANLRDAAAIVVGTVVSIDPKTHAHVIAVDGVWKGTPGKRLSIDLGTGDCAFGTLGVGTRWVVFAEATGVVRPCGGTTRATPAAVADVTRRLGAPRRP